MTSPAAPAIPASAPLPALRFHRLFRALPRYRWWRSLVAVVLAAIYWLVFQSVWSIVFLVVGIFAGSVTVTLDQDQLLQSITRFLSIDTTNPLSIVAAVGGVATMLPAVLLACLCVGIRPLSVLRSVRFRLRWRWMLLCLLPATGITALALAVGAFLLPAVGLSEPVQAPTVPIGTFVVSAIAFLVVTPVQAAAEEFGFRGLVQQAIGGWVKPVWVAILGSTVLFALAHTQYFGWATLDVAVFGGVAAFLTWRTGGLEAGIALHAVNNTLAFLLQATGSLGSTQAVDTEHPTAGDPLSVLVTVVTMGIYVGIVELLLRRRREPLAVVLEPLPGATASAPVPPPDPASLRQPAIR
ncbi:lysostaphin resistance A-like protein [Pseudolysinimonas sp.]|uniref:CPBP family intramembrane glutamic endopeptidase n=1 Tax=Pseudolysinimonas sp. TaxID=2680009 RepID=UPI003F80A19A